MEQSLIDFYIERTGKKAEEITVLEYEALNIALEFAEIVSSSVQEPNQELV